MNRTIAITAAAGLLMTGAVAGCANASPGVTDQAAVTAAFGGGPRGGPRMGGGMQVALTGTAQLTVQEKRNLRYMVEEEKLAHDLYVLAYDTHGLQIFANIARSETQHQQAIQRVLAAYSIKDPSRGMPAGEFRDADLQALYDTLAEKVQESQEAALQVGITVEETDIADLRETRVGMPREVRLVLDQLMAASEQHLRAFTAWSN